MKGEKLNLFPILAAVGLFLILFSIRAARPLHLDDIDFASAAETTLHSGKPVYYRGEQNQTHLGLYHPPLYIYLLAGWFAIFGSGVPQARLFGLLCVLIHAWTCLAVLKQLFGWDYARRVSTWFVPLFLVSSYTLQVTAILDIDSTIYGPLLNLLLLSVVKLSWENGERRKQPPETMEILQSSLFFALAMWAKLTSIWLAAPLMFLLLNDHFGWKKAAKWTAAITVSGMGIFLSTYFVYGRLTGLRILYTFEFTWNSLIQRGSHGGGFAAKLQAHLQDLWYMLSFTVRWTGLVPWLCAAYLCLHGWRERRRDARVGQLAYIVLFALLGTAYYCAQQTTFAAAPFKYTFVYWGWVIAAAAALLPQTVSTPGSNLVCAAVFLAGAVIGFQAIGDAPLTAGNFSRSTLLITMLFAAAPVAGLALRAASGKFLPARVFALGMVLYLGDQAGVCLWQTRAPYSTGYDYGQAGIEDAAAYIRAETAPSEKIASMKDLGYASGRRYFENYFGLYGDEEALRFLENAIASKRATLAVFTEGHGQDQLEIRPELKAWVATHCTRVASFGDYRIYRYTAGE